MKIKKKMIFFGISSLFIAPSLVVISCAKTTDPDIQTIENFIKTLQPKIKESKVIEKQNTEAVKINTETLVQEWFNGLPESNNEIKVQFDSAYPLPTDSTILEVKYIISIGEKSRVYTFQESGFKFILSESLKDFGLFSERNSFRVEFQISGDPNGGSSFITSGGTAWSWYYKKTGDYSYDWYLMTNLHVVTQAVALLNKDNLGGTLLDWYYNNTVTTAPKNYNFYLSRWDENIKGYKHLASTSFLNDDLAVKAESIKNLQIITDFDNDSIDLFSKSEGGRKLYNMDMALIKFEFDFTNRKDHINPKYQRPNIFEMYQQNKDKWFQNRFNDNKNIFVGGHPSSQSKLIYYEFTPPFDIEYGLLQYNDFILKHLKAPYFHSKNWIADYKLTEGASGSAVYQKTDSPFAWENIVPIGIYWGGLAPYTDDPVQNKFKPSMIPLIVNNWTFEDTLDKQNVTLSYNIYDNFANYIKDKY